MQGSTKMVEERLIMSLPFEVSKLVYAGLEESGAIFLGTLRLRC